MSSSSSVPFPTPKSPVKSQPSLLAKWKRDARLSITGSRSVSRVNVVISSPRPLGSAGTRRDTLLPRASNNKKRSHTEVTPNENLDIDADRSRTRQRTDSESTIKASSSSPSSKASSSTSQREASRIQLAADARDDASSGQTRSSQALQALKTRLRIKTTRDRTEAAVALSNDSPIDAVSACDSDLARLAAPKEASRELTAVRPDAEKKTDKANEENCDLSIAQPERPRRHSGRKTKSVHFSVPLSEHAPAAAVETAILKDTSILKTNPMPLPLQPRSANTLHVSSTPVLAIGAKPSQLSARDEAIYQARKNSIFKTVSLKPDELKFAIEFYDTPHFEIWDMRDDICLAWPAELRLKVVDPDRFEFTSIRTPEISRIELCCRSKRYVEDTDHKLPFAVCEADSFYSVSYSGAVCIDERTSTMNPEAGIHLNTDWARTYTRRVPVPQVDDDKREVTRGRKAAKATKVIGERGWVMKFWIPIPTHLFVKRETRSFIIESRVWLEDDGREIPDDQKAFKAESEMTISHLRRAREMV